MSLNMWSLHHRYCNAVYEDLRESAESSLGNTDGIQFGMVVPLHIHLLLFDIVAILQ